MQIFSKYNNKGLENLEFLSPDFKNMKLFQTQQFIPLSWEYAGWSHNSKPSFLGSISLKDFFIKKMKKRKAQLFLYDDAFELYQFLKRLDYVTPNWINNNQEKKLKNAVKDFNKKNLKFVPLKEIKKDSKLQALFPIRSSVYHQLNL